MGLRQRGNESEMTSKKKKLRTEKKKNCEKKKKKKVPKKKGPRIERNKREVKNRQTH
jgi:hypothetical protein